MDEQGFESAGGLWSVGGELDGGRPASLCGLGQAHHTVSALGAEPAAVLHHVVGRAICQLQGVAAGGFGVVGVPGLAGIAVGRHAVFGVDGDDSRLGELAVHLHLIAQPYVTVLGGARGCGQISDEQRGDANQGVCEVLHTFLL